MKLFVDYLELKKIRFSRYVDSSNEPITPLIPCYICSPNTFYKRLISYEKSYGLFMSSPYGFVYLGVLDEVMANELCNEEVSLSDSDFTHNIHVCEIQNNHIEIIKYFPNIDKIIDSYKFVRDDGWLNDLLEAFK